jgi:hypothetical protein
MPEHPRTQLVEAVVALLTNATTAGARVYDHRVDPIKDLPAIVVYAWDESSDQEGSSPPNLLRELDVDVVLYVEHTEAVSAPKAANRLALQVEAVFDANPFLQGLAENSYLKTTAIGVRPQDGGGSPLVGEATLTFGVLYRTKPIPPTLVDDLTTVKNTIQPIGGVADTPPDVDQFTVET